MADPIRLRDSTQIVLPVETLEQLDCELEAEFAVTVTEDGSTARIIGSPMVIKTVTEHLTRHGVALP